MRFHMMLRPLMLVACLVGAGAALAADTMLAVQPGLLESIAYGIATLVVGAVAFVAQKLFGLTIDARHREALHSAVRTGSALALSTAADWVAKGQSPEKARLFGEQRGLDYIRTAVPDALAHFRQADSERMLLDMVRAATVQIAPPQASAALATL